MTDVCVYWFTNTAATSANLYYENRTAPPADRAGDRAIGVPTGVAVFPTDPAIRRVLDRAHLLTHWSEYDVGGHFAAPEVPELLVEDLRAFGRSLRGRAG